MSVVESKLTLFEVQEEIGFRNSVEFSKSAFAERPKAFDAIDMIFAPCQFVFVMINPVMIVAI
jgi:hypothetical protein